MIRLIYFSQEKQPLSAEQMNEILHVSRRNNAAQEITGVLVRGGGMYLQILEGTEQAVLRLYVKLLNDPRHDEIGIVIISLVSTRMFAQWSMGSIDCDRLQFQDLMALRALRVEHADSAALANVMRQFQRTLTRGALPA